MDNECCKVVTQLSSNLVTLLTWSILYEGCSKRSGSSHPRSSDTDTLLRGPHVSYRCSGYFGQVYSFTTFWKWSSMLGKKTIWLGKGKETMGCKLCVWPTIQPWPPPVRTSDTEADVQQRYIKAEYKGLWQSVHICRPGNETGLLCVSSLQSALIKRD